MAGNTGRRTSSSGSKKKSSGSKAAGQSRRKTDKKQLEQDSALFHEIGLIVLFVAMVLLFCCNFGLIGPVGDAVSGFLFGVFGFSAYLVPVLLFLAAAFGYANEGNPTAVRKLISGCVLFVMFGVICDLISKNSLLMAEYSVKVIYEKCSTGKNGGGILAGSLSYLLQHYLETIGTILVVMLCSVISLIILTEKSLIKSMKNGGSRVRELSREDARRRREEAGRRRENAELKSQERAAQRAQREEERRLRAEEKENEKILRMEKKVSGVMADTTLIKPEEHVHRDDIHEIMYREDEERQEEDGFSGNFAETVQETAYESAPVLDFEKIRIRSMHQVTVDEAAYGQESGFGAEQTETGFTYDGQRADFAPEQTGYGRTADYEPEQTGYGRTADYEPEQTGYGRTADYEPEQTGYGRTADYETGMQPDEPESSAYGRASDYAPGIHTAASASFGQTQTKADGMDSGAAIRIHKEGVEENERPAAKPQAAAPMPEVQREISHAEKKLPKKYMFPPISRLQKGVTATEDSTKELKETAVRLQQTLNTFGVKVTITDISQGPSVTRYELQPEQGVKVSKIVGLTDDIKLNLAATDIRIEAPIPGKAAIGIEVPNKESIPVALRDLLESREFKEFPSNLAFAVGKDIAGKVVVADIAKMPHMLIAGATGSGKSVCINTLIMSILYKAHPDDVKLIMVDPKVVELSVYNGIPHLLIPVVTDPKKASAALHWGVSEMEDRYRKFADYNVRDIKGYNQKVESMREKGDPEAPAKLPQIVIIVDELADLMMVSPGEVEESICRLAQLARAAGIHLIIATQRPSVDVITGLIKANMPSRVAFSVSSGVDSRTILDMNGAEKLLGKGDMLFYPQGYSKPARIQGAFVSDKEVSDVVDFLKNQTLGNTYAEDIEEKIQNIGSGGTAADGGSELDELFEKAGRFIIEQDKASIGALQRLLKIGFNRAARIMDQLCEYGVVDKGDGTKPRRILMSPEQFEQLVEEIV